MDVGLSVTHSCILLGSRATIQDHILSMVNLWPRSYLLTSPTPTHEGADICVPDNTLKYLFVVRSSYVNVYNTNIYIYTAIRNHLVRTSVFAVCLQE